MSHTPCTTCNDPACGGCDPCNDKDNYCVCLGRQIEQLKNRTDQLKAQLECLNPDEPLEGLCPIQTCDSPDCQNIGTICENESPTGRLVGAGDGGDSCCGSDAPATTREFCDEIFAKVRELEKLSARHEKLICEIRRTALRTVLLDSNGNARGGLAINGDLKSFTVGSWEAATS